MAFYRRFFDRRSVTAYYSTKLKDDGSVDTGGCEELQRIVKAVLDDGRTDRVIGIMDTDYRKYVKGYTYPPNIFNTDHRDMEMTALSTPSVRHALSTWINDFEARLESLEPMLRHAGTLRIMNELFRLGCNFRGKCKIDKVYDEYTHSIYCDWKKRYDSAFLKSTLLNKKKSAKQKMKTVWDLCKAIVYGTCYSYHGECSFDILQGHDTIQLLSLSTGKISTYSNAAIWEKCFDAYTPTDFTRTRLFAAINAWQRNKGLSLFKASVA